MVPFIKGSKGRVIQGKLSFKVHEVNWGPTKGIVWPQGGCQRVTPAAGACPVWHSTPRRGAPPAARPGQPVSIHSWQRAKEHHVRCCSDWSPKRRIWFRYRVNTHDTSGVFKGNTIKFLHLFSWVFKLYENFFFIFTFLCFFIFYFFTGHKTLSINVPSFQRV